MRSTSGRDTLWTTADNDKLNFVANGRGVGRSLRIPRLAHRLQSGWLSHILKGYGTKELTRWFQAAELPMATETTATTAVAA